MDRRIYLDNYWSLFFDFVEAFEELTYYNIPIPLLVNFRHHLDEDIKKKMTFENFKRNLRSSIKREEIQLKFEKWINIFRQQQSIQPLPDKGKILLNYRYLRFSRSNLLNYFTPKEAFILSQKGKNNLLGLPMYDINDFHVDVGKIAKKMIEEAKIIFKGFSTHQIFNNSSFYKSFLKIIPEIIAIIAAVNRFLDNNPTSCIVVGTTEDLMSRILSLVGATKGIPSICMQHGLLCGEEAYMPVFSSKVCVYGHYDKEWYRKRGVPTNMIEITGHPRFDDIFMQKHINKNIFLKTYRLNPTKKIILCATQPNNPTLWKDIIERLANNSKFEILIKPHPIEMTKVDNKGKKLIENYMVLQRKYKNIRVISNRKVNLYDFLSNIDAAIIFSSTVGLETILFNKPLFVFNDNSSDYYFRMKDFIFSEPSKLVDFINKYFEDKRLANLSKERNKEFLKYAYPQKLSGPILKEVINGLINESLNNE